MKRGISKAVISVLCLCAFVSPVHAATKGTAADRAAAKKLVRLDDMRDGWAEDNSDSDDSGGPKCLRALKTPAVKAEGTARFSASLDGRSFLHEVGVYKSEADARVVFNKFSATLSTCKTEKLKIEGNKATFAVGRMALRTKSASQTDVWRFDITVAANGITATVTGPLFIYRQGAVVGIVLDIDLGGPDLDETVQLINTAISRSGA